MQKKKIYISIFRHFKILSLSCTRYEYNVSRLTPEYTILNASFQNFTGGGGLCPLDPTPHPPSIIMLTVFNLTCLKFWIQLLTNWKSCWPEMYFAIYRINESLRKRCKIYFFIIYIAHRFYVNVLLLMQVELLIPLWIQTTKPYIEVIDEWITNGNLVDPRSEFILKRFFIYLNWTKKRGGGCSSQV